MKILLMIAQCYDNSTSMVVMGGLGAAYQKHGHSLVIAGLKPPHSNKPTLEITPLAPIWRLERSASRGQPHLSALSRKIESLASNTDFIHLHFWGQYNSDLWATWNVSQRLGVPMGITFQDYANPVLPSHPNWQKARLERVLSDCAWVTALSHFSARQLVRDFSFLQRRIRVIPNGHDPSKITRIAHVSRKYTFVLCTARLLRYKGIDLLLMAWKDVCAEIPDVNLVLCGQDHEHERGRYQRLAKVLGISSRVQFIGQVDHGKVLRLMRSCLFSVLPSRHEAFGMAALEAMACGKAVLTVAQGPRDFMKDGVSGMFIPPMKIEPLRNGLLKLLRTPSLRRKLGAGARRAARQYSWDNAAKSYLRLIS